MNLIEKATIIHYHRQRIARYGQGTAQALGWQRRERQLKRFEAITGVGDLAGCSILDVGCGCGDLKRYLDQRAAQITYIGIDQMPEFIANARERHKDAPDTYFFQADFTTAMLSKADYVLASGALSYRCDNPDFPHAMIRKLYAAATRALAFNLLDAASFPEHPLLVGYDVDEIASFCRTLGSRVEVVRGYLRDDVTVFLYADRHGTSLEE